jgi:hypothetical protein
MDRFEELLDGECKRQSSNSLSQAKIKKRRSCGIVVAEA